MQQCTFSGTNNIHTLKLRQTCISTLDSYTLYHFGKVEYLDVSSSNIHSVEYMRAFLSLVWRNISGNEPNILDKTTFNMMYSLQTIVAGDFTICCIFYMIKVCCPKVKSFLSCKRIIPLVAYRSLLTILSAISVILNVVSLLSILDGGKKGNQICCFWQLFITSELSLTAIM